MTPQIDKLLATVTQADEYLARAGAAVAEARGALAAINRDGPNDLVPRVGTIAAALERALVLASAKHLDLSGIRATHAETILRTASEEAVRGANMPEAVAAAVRA